MFPFLYTEPSHLSRRTQLIGDTNLTKAQQNILAGGGQLETGIVSDTRRTKRDPFP